MAIFSTRMRYTGLSGIDTASMVEAIMKAESLRYDNLKKTRQRTAWQQEAYKTHADALFKFQRGFLDSMGSSSMRLRSNFRATTARLTIGGMESNKATVRSGSGTPTGTYNLNIAQLAQNDVYRGSQVRSVVASRDDFDLSKFKDGDSINVTFNGRTVRFDFGGDNGIRIGSGNAAFLSDFNTRLSDAFGSSRAQVSLVGGKLTFNVPGNDTLTVTEAHGRQSVTVPGAGAAFNPDIPKGTEFTFTIDGVFEKDSVPPTLAAITFKYGENAAETVSAINAALRAKGVNNLAASYDSGDENGVGAGFRFSAVGTTQPITVSAITPKEPWNPENPGTPEPNPFGIGFGGGFTLQPTSVLDSVMGISNGTTNAFGTGRTTTEGFFSDLSPRPDTININGVNIALDIYDKDDPTKRIDETVQQFMNRVNSSGAGVRMSFDTISQSFRIESISAGASNAIRFDDNARDVFGEAFGINFSARKDEDMAQDSIFTLNGQTFVRESNNVSVGGLSLTLNETTGPDETIRIEVGRDVDGVFDMIKSFVEAYNKLIDDINSAVNQKRARTGTHSFYEPLTDDQRSAMKDHEILQWEAKAKEGILSRDQTLANITSRMRADLYESVDLGDGRKISLYEIGITTTSRVADQGRLEIDEEKLRAALESRPDDIATLFAGNDTGTVQGLADRLNGIVERAIGREGSLTRIVGSDFWASTLTNNQMYHLMRRQDDQLADMLIMLRRKEEAYYMKFSKMEAAIMNSNSQMSYLQSMMGM